MRTRIFTDHPESTYQAIVLLCRYFEQSGEHIVIHWKALKRASRLLKLMADTDEEGTIYWVRGKDWKSRLVLAGLDPETLEIVDQMRWDLAWEQMSRTHTFRDDVQVRRLALGREAPRADAFLRAKVLSGDGKVRRQKRKEGEMTSVIDYMSREQRRVFKRRK